MLKEVVLSALLHDIGRIIHPATGQFKTYHNLGEEWAKRWAAQKDVSQSVVDTIAHHHERLHDLTLPLGTRNLVWLIQQADSIATGAKKGECKQDQGVFDSGPALPNIFAEVNLFGRQEAKHGYWPLKYDGYPQMREVLHTRQQYETLWEAMEKEINLVEAEPESLERILRKHLYNVPEDTSATDQFVGGTSLYWHLKITAALAVSMYYYVKHIYDFKWQCEDVERIEIHERPYMLVAGDVSGIQRFVYRVPHRRALRLLRARSFFLELLSETMITKILEKSGYPRVNLLYSGGGTFLLLLANTDKEKLAINQAVKEVNDYLWQHFRDDLFLAVAYHEVSGKELIDAAGEAISSVRETANSVKQERWRERLGELFRAKPVPQEECPACGAKCSPHDMTGSEDERLCRLCARLSDLGHKLPDIRELWQSDTFTNDTLIDIAGISYSLKGPGKRCYLIQDSFREPQKGERNTIAFPAFFPVGEPELQKVAEASWGLKRLGFLRMDVDHLGEIFRSGLPISTLARASDISDRLNTYFKEILPQKLDNMLKEKSPCFGVKRTSVAINMVYAGGDDLFLIAPWDQALDAAAIINEDFRRFTGYNPSITLSAGISIAEEKHPVQRGAKDAGSEEGRAKNAGRDRLSIAGKVIRWEEISHVTNLLSRLKKDGERYLLNEGMRPVVQHLLLLIRSGDEALLPKIYYYCRAPGRKKVLEAVLLGINQPWLEMALEVADLAGRGNNK